jgi:hypothetical protein
MGNIRLCSSYYELINRELEDDVPLIPQCSVRIMTDGNIKPHSNRALDMSTNLRSLAFLRLSSKGGCRQSGASKWRHVHRNGDVICRERKVEVRFLVRISLTTERSAELAQCSNMPYSLRRLTRAIIEYRVNSQRKQEITTMTWRT